MAAKQLNPCASTYPHCYLSWWFSSRFICLTKPKNCPRAVCCRSNVFRAVLHPAVHCTQPCTQVLLCRCSLVFRLMTWGGKGPFFPSPLFLNHKNGIIHSPISRYRDIISLKSLNRLFFCLLVNRKRLCWERQMLHEEDNWSYWCYFLSQSVYLESLLYECFQPANFSVLTFPTEINEKIFQ